MHELRFEKVDITAQRRERNEGSEDSLRRMRWRAAFLALATLTDMKIHGLGLAFLIQRAPHRLCQFLLHDGFHDEFTNAYLLGLLG